MKKMYLFLMAIALIFVMTACSENEEAGESDELTEIDVMLDWYPNAVHSFLYVAQEKGYFEDEGIKVNIQYPANATDPLTLAAAGKVTLGFYYQPDVVMARANENVPVKAVGSIVRSPLNHAVVLENSDIQSPKDLEGKNVGYPGIPLNEALIQTMVASDGGDPEKVDLVDVGFELGSSLVTEQVDAVIGAFVNHEVPVLKHEGHNTRYFNPVDYGVPEYHELIAVTSDQTWEENEEEIKAFWRAATKGYEFMAENQDEALKILLDNQEEENFPLVEEVEAESMEILLPKMESENGFGSQDKDSWQETIDWLSEVGLIEEKPSVEDIVVDVGE
ncbi:ABC transporter substrate-binding protein [Salinibacillus xinjiangensis]|uniref:ABC transporter substrate-binding protein n=1 Tax=Salinibacillus xinjiangensis TaxID=1229268 RepID=A0A6G1XB36_9BACI|nr:ABC transporter substrate-binding protein [Salinibacillus xinjiangensis]MRG88090.1 ABC transporter substrate-binding protein [Salinibacillus xinjiangensis]